MAKTCLLPLMLVSALGAVYPAQAQQRLAPPDTVATRVSVLGANCALFPAAAQLPDYVDYYVTHSRRFTPMQQQVAATEQALRRLCASASLVLKTRRDAAARNEVAAQLGRDCRQYFGFFNQHQPCLLLNCADGALLDVPAGLPPSVLPNWLAEPVSFSDTGRLYGSVCYNLATRQLVNFWYDLDLGGG